MSKEGGHVCVYKLHKIFVKKNSEKASEVIQRSI